MHKLPAAPRSGARAPLFAVSAALSLLVALVCALLPTGLPSSANLGSAFSPSSVAVSLSAPGQARIAGKRLEADGDSGRTAPLERLLTGAAGPPAPPADAPFAFPATPDLSPHLPAPSGGAWPRAPPVV